MMKTLGGGSLFSAFKFVHATVEPQRLGHFDESFAREQIFQYQENGSPPWEQLDILVQQNGGHGDIPDILGCQDWNDL